MVLNLMYSFVRYVWFMHEIITSYCVHSTYHFVLQYAVDNTACSLIYYVFTSRFGTTVRSYMRLCFRLVNFQVAKCGISPCIAVF